jgi:hypothetical protein
MKATGWKKMKSTPRISQDFVCLIITAHRGVTKLTDAQQFARINKTDTAGANPLKVN